MVNVLFRIIWFIFIGWWLALLWLVLSLLVCITIIGFPIGLWMLGQTWKIATLARNANKVAGQFVQQVQQVTVVNNMPGVSENNSKESAIVILEKRYANGEITKEEFTERKKVLLDK